MLIAMPTAAMLLNEKKILRKGRRQLLGFPSNGQRTRSKARASKKLNSALLQFYVWVYKKYFNLVFSTALTIVFKAQAVNCLFYLNWPLSWEQAHLKSYLLKSKKSLKLHYNLEKAAKGIAVGYDREGRAAMRGKARSKIAATSIGMPVNMIEAFITKNTGRLRFCATTK